MEGQLESVAVQGAETCRREFEEFMSSSGWQQVDSSNGMVSSKLERPDKLDVVKIVGELPFPMEVVANFLIDYRRRTEYNKNLVKIEEIARFSDELLVLTHEVKIKWPMDNRDFVYTYNILREDNRVLILAKSFEGAVPEKRGIVRGSIEASHFVLEPNGDRTNMTYFICINPKGNVAKGIIKKMNQKQGDTIKAIIEALSK